MKAEMDGEGRLTVTAQTPLEAYALKIWQRQARISEKSLIVTVDIEEDYQGPMKTLSALMKEQADEFREFLRAKKDGKLMGSPAGPDP